MTSSPIILTDVSLRDGLQAEARTLSTDTKVSIFENLAGMGFERLEITSFVNPKWIPQLAGAEALCARIEALGLSQQTMAFVPNKKGLERLLRFKIEWVSAFVAASETFNRKNVNMGIQETLGEIGVVRELAKRASRQVRVYLSTAFGCPYEGEVNLKALDHCLKQLSSLAPDEVVLSDTIGVATPVQVGRVIDVASQHFSLERIGVHFHNTYAMGLAATQAAFDRGVRRFDGSTGGIGGCPYAKGATGNLASEEIWYLFFRQGLRRGFSVAQLTKCFECLEGAGLTLSSALAPIVARGGEIYGCQ